MSDLDRAIETLATKESILVFTGAGISTESGIPDFRGPDGVWSRVDPADFTIDRYLASAEVRERSWAMRARSGALDAKPNSGHRAVVSLWRSGVLAGCVTQNIDGLHQAAGLPPDQVVELHGNAHVARCMGCGSTDRTKTILARLESDPDPHCAGCGDLLKVDVVFFGEQMPAAAMTKAMALATQCDAVIAAGSTLSVYPAAYVPLTAVETGAPLVIINQGETELDSMASVIVGESTGSTLSAIAAALE